MKSISILLSAILMAAITPAFAQATSGTQSMKLDQNMQSMKMHQNMPCMKVGKGMPMDGMPMAGGTNSMSMHKGMRRGQMGQGMQGMQSDKNTMPCAQQTAHGTGVVEAIDTAKGTATIQHQSIASIHWPAMTMTFKVDPPSLLQSVKVGEKMTFTLHPNGMNSTVTDISPVK